MILVTGGSGFLGLQLLQLLVLREQPIKAVYNSTLPQFQHPLIEWVQADLLDIYAVAALFDGVTHVYNCAAMVSFDSQQKELLIQNNIHCTQHIVNEALERGIEKMVHVSSIASLGRAEVNKSIDEDTFWKESKENSTYAQSKFHAEMEVWRGIAEGLCAVIVNPGIILGEGDYSKGSAQLMTNVAKEFPYYTQGVNGYIDVIDVAKAMILLMDSAVEEERFILSEGNYSYQELFTMMANALDVKPPTKHATPFMTEIVWRMDYLKSKLSGKHALITKETARTARTKCYYNNEKFLNAFPEFTYTPIQQTIVRMAEDFKRQKH